MSEQQIMEALQEGARQHAEWAPYVPLLADPSVTVHLAIMVEPFMDYILCGQKTIESRFSKNAIAPYQQVAVGDLVLLKAGPVAGAFSVSSVDCLNLTAERLAKMRRDHAAAICAEDNAFWEARADKRYATLIGVKDVRKLPPVNVPKRDMRGWVVLRVGRTTRRP